MPIAIPIRSALIPVAPAKSQITPPMSGRIGEMTPPMGAFLNIRNTAATRRTSASQLFALKARYEADAIKKAFIPYRLLETGITMAEYIQLYCGLVMLPVTRPVTTKTTIVTRRRTL